MTADQSTAGKLAPQAWMVAPETIKVMEALHSEGGEARFVGGCVRNALCNRKVIDIDIATPLKPDQVIERLVRAKIGYAPTGFKHGTVTAVVDGKPFEITTLRCDVFTYGRHADVEFTDDWKIDASRRDFTINAMFATMDGDIYDPFGGIDDLRRGRVVFVGDPERRITEDYLRILRFFRFYAHFGQGPADKAALAACSKHAASINKLSVERIRQETLKIFEADSVPAVWLLMIENRIGTYFLPEATNLAALERLVMLERKYESPSFALRRLAAVCDVTPEGIRNLSQGLRLSNAQSAQFERMLLGDRMIHADMEHADVRRLVYRYGNDMVRSLLLINAARTGDENDFYNLYNWATTFRAPRFPLQGEDVIRLGIAQGPDVGAILSTIEAWWMGQDFMPGRTQCLDMLRAIYAPSGK